MSYEDPMTGGADMSITFKNHEDAKWLCRHLRTGKVFSSLFGNSVFFFKRDFENIQYLLIDPSMEHEIKDVKYMSVEDAIDRTINKL